MTSGDPLIIESYLPDYSLWDKIAKERKVISFNLEITARCNNNCRHCYINLPARDGNAAKEELTVDEISRIADEAVDMGALWCLISGGEPMLRKDFKEIYLLLKKKGLLVSVFTNATLVDKDIIGLFKKYPPRGIEVSIYGVTEATYEKVTGKKGSFKAFTRGLNLLLDNGVPFTLKSIAMKSNFHEMSHIASFCMERSKDPYRYDPMLHLRYDRDQNRNKEILEERLTPADIILLETSDPKRFGTIMKNCDELIINKGTFLRSDHVFDCSTGKSDFTISYDGILKPCSSICVPELTLDIRHKKGAIEDGLNKIVEKAFGLRSQNKEFMERCGSCKIKNLCISCPAHAWLETGHIDKPVDYFCSVAKARASTLLKNVPKE